MHVYISVLSAYNIQAQLLVRNNATLSSLLFPN